MFDEVIAASKTAATTSLDIGCGTGDLTVKFAQRGFNAYGMDLAQSAINKAKARADEAGLSNKTNFAVGEIGAVITASISEQKFDITTCKLVLAFISDKESALQWMRNHLNENGALIIITPIKRLGREYSLS